MKTTAVGNDEGPSSQELWDKLDKIDKQNQIMLEVFDRTLLELQQSVRGMSGQKLRQLHSQMRLRIISLEGGPAPHGEG